MAISNNGVFLSFFFFNFLLAIFSGGGGGGVQSQDCQPSSKLKGKEGACSGQNQSECCEGGKLYSTFHCSPKVSRMTPATLTLNSFQKGGDGGSPCSCDGKFHSDNTPVVALSTGWFDKQIRCGKNITIMANGKKVNAMVVDECDSTLGCDNDHDFQPPCQNNIVDGSKAVWQALEIPKKNWGQLSILWTDASTNSSSSSPDPKKKENTDKTYFYVIDYDIRCMEIDTKML